MNWTDDVLNKHHWDDVGTAFVHQKTANYKIFMLGDKPVNGTCAWDELWE